MRLIAAFILSLSFCGFLSAPPNAYAEHTRHLQPIPDNRCGELVRECFAYSGEERSECFFTCSQHPYCAGNALGKLSEKRWAISPNHIVDHQEADALLGPQLVDPACLSNFDNQFSGELIRGEIPTERIEELRTRLDSCRRAPAMEMLRPY